MAGIEPATDGLRNRCSTAELHWRKRKQTDEKYPLKQKLERKNALGSVVKAGLWLARRGFLMLDDRRRNGADGLKNLTRGFGIGNLESIRFVQGDHQLQGVHGIQTDTTGAKQRLVVADFVRADLEHEVLDHQLLDVPFDRRCIVHHKLSACTRGKIVRHVRPEGKPRSRVH